MRDQTINSSPQVEPLIVGNANGIIRFLALLKIKSTLKWLGFID